MEGFCVPYVKLSPDSTLFKTLLEELLEQHEYQRKDIIKSLLYMYNHG